ncbi:MAG: AAA family ATPase [Atopobium sp.]|nr:AAA family ATPase [Atopobium sp.]
MPSEEKKESLEIQKVIIRGFKRIRGPLTIKLDKPLTILVGNNGAGKTTILEAVQLACTGQYRGESIRRALSQSLLANPHSECNGILRGSRPGTTYDDACGDMHHRRHHGRLQPSWHRGARGHHGSLEGP